MAAALLPTTTHTANFTNGSGFFANGFDNNKYADLTYLEGTTTTGSLVKVECVVATRNAAAINLGSCQMLVANNAWLPAPQNITDNVSGSVSGVAIQAAPDSEYDNAAKFPVCGSCVSNGTNDGIVFHLACSVGMALGDKVMLKASFVYKIA